MCLVPCTSYEKSPSSDTLKHYIDFFGAKNIIYIYLFLVKKKHYIHDWLNLLISNAVTTSTPRWHVGSYMHTLYSWTHGFAYVLTEQACLLIWNSLTSICLLICSIYVYTHKAISVYTICVQYSSIYIVKHVPQTRFNQMLLQKFFYTKKEKFFYTFLGLSCNQFSFANTSKYRMPM